MSHIVLVISKVNKNFKKHFLQLMLHCVTSPKLRNHPIPISYRSTLASASAPVENLSWFSVFSTSRKIAVVAK